MSLRELQPSDLQLTNCVWRAPDGLLYLPLPHVVPYFATLAANAAALNDVEVATPPRYDFLCKAVAFTGTTPGTLLQIQWPDGRYLSNVPMDFFSFVGTGKRGRLIDPHKRMRPSSKIRLNIDNSQVGSASNIELYFEGCLLIPMVKNA